MPTSDLRILRSTSTRRYASAVDLDLPAEDPLVPDVEAALDVRATRRPLISPYLRPSSPVALWLCACVSDAAAPTWVMWLETVGVAWSRVPTGVDERALVDASRWTGAHVDPAEVLSWLESRAALPDDQVEISVVELVEQALRPS